MAVTRINNNQITDASAGNVYLGINANTKLQNYSITSGKLANGLVYGSDLTVSGNLTVNGSSTTIDTTITTIEDPVIILASTQTGTPAVDIGFLGERGDETNIAFVWDESAQEFVTVFTSTSETNTTVTITGYANAHVGNMVVGGTTSISGNVIGTANFSGNVNSANVSATGNITAAYFIGNISGNIDAAGSNTQVQFNDTGDILGASAGFTFDKTANLLTVTGNVDGGNVNTGGLVSATGNVTGGNVLTGGLVSATGNVTGGNLVSATVTNPTAMSIVTNAGNINLEPAGNVVINNTYINGLQLTPVQDSDAASKYYVDTIATTGLTFHEAVAATTNTTLATETGGTISYTQPNGVSNGIGAYIQTTGTFTTIDTANVQTVGTRILVKNEANAVLNGVYTYSNSTAIVRSTDTDQYGADSAESFSINDYFFTTGGNVNNGAAFVVDAPAGVITFGTSNITFAQFSSSQTYTANTAAGLLLINQQFNAKVDNETTAFDGGGNISVKVSANLTTPNIGAATGTSLSVTGTVTAASTVGGIITGSSASISGNITGGNLETGGLISATATITGGNLETGGTASVTGNVTGGNISTAGALQGGNIVISGDDITDTNGRVNFNTAGADVDFAVNGDTVANAFYVDAGTGTASFGSATQTVNAIVAFNSTNSILAPVGNTAQRPATGVTGMLRFNSTNNNLELYDNSEWTAVGVPVFTVIDDQQFNGDGSTVAFTLSSTQTTNSCIVSINGVVQIPILAYSVSGTDPSCVLTFTEAPEPGDIIDVREITTTTSVTSIANSSGNAVIAVSDSSATTTITGDLTVTGNATILGNVATNQINNGSSAVQIPTTNGNVVIDINGVDNIYTFSQFNMLASANITPTANVTYDLGTTTNRWKDIWLSNSTIYMGNAQISANATSLIFTNPEGGQTVLAGATAGVTGATVSASGNITGGNVLTGGLVSASGNITGGNLSVSTGLVTLGGIVNANGNAVGNIGSSSNYFNTVFAKATSAQYADLAEKYTADAEYVPGTVVVFGGTAEVTVNAVDGDTKVAGVVSTNPSYTMNSGLDGEHVATVALTGRVPTMVVGTVRKGDLMVAAGLGRARAESDPKVGAVIGKALEDFDGAEGTIEVVVGRF